LRKCPRKVLKPAIQIKLTEETEHRIKKEAMKKERPRKETFKLKKKG
jgi:hypothetical protein